MPVVAVKVLEGIKRVILGKNAQLGMLQFRAIY